MKWLWPRLKCYPEICLERAENQAKLLSGTPMSGMRFELRASRIRSRSGCVALKSSVLLQIVTATVESSDSSCAAIQELPSILWNPRLHYRVHKSPLLVPILSQINPVHTTASYLSKIHLSIIQPPTSWSLSFWVSHQHPICIRLLLLPPIVLHALPISFSLTWSF
jgi:hypothetical protein